MEGKLRHNRRRTSLCCKKKERHCDSQSVERQRRRSALRTRERTLMRTGTPPLAATILRRLVRSGRKRARTPHYHGHHWCSGRKTGAKWETPIYSTWNIAVQLNLPKSNRPPRFASVSFRAKVQVHSRPNPELGSKGAREWRSTRTACDQPISPQRRWRSEIFQHR